MSGRRDMGQDRVPSRARCCEPGCEERVLPPKRGELDLLGPDRLDEIRHAERARVQEVFQVAAHALEVLFGLRLWPE